MQIPESLRRSIEAASADIPFSRLRDAAASLSAAYRSVSAKVTPQVTREIAAAYVVTRMPATYAAMWCIFEELDRSGVLKGVCSVLDAGAGTGAATFVAAQWIDGLASSTLIERERKLVDLGARFVRDALPFGTLATDWRVSDLTSLSRLPETDLSLCSYVLNEFPPHDAIQIARRLFAASRIGAVYVEPGTPAGFALIRRIRSELIAYGGHVAAPCPHDGECPIDDGDWCHFAARVERTGLHRRLKGGELSYEDEKFTYVAVTHDPIRGAMERVVRRPQKHQGLVSLGLCGPTGLHTLRVTKRDKVEYKRARKTEWGDAWI